MTQELKVFMHSTLVDELDESLSPMDGLVAIEQVFGQLPRLHAAKASKRRLRRGARRIPIYRSRFGWVDLGFTYVQVGQVLHVIDLWHDSDWMRPDRRDVDFVLNDLPDANSFITYPHD
jgi:hypothetical protein